MKTVLLILLTTVIVNAQKAAFVIDLKDFNNEAIKVAKLLEERGVKSLNISSQPEQLINDIKTQSKLARLDKIDTLIIYITVHGDIRNNDQYLYNSGNKTGVALSDVIKTVKSFNNDLFLIIFVDACRQWSDYSMYFLPDYHNLYICFSQTEGRVTNINGLFYILFLNNEHIKISEIRLKSWEIMRNAVAVFYKTKEIGIPHPQEYYNIDSKDYKNGCLF